MCGIFCPDSLSYFLNRFLGGFQQQLGLIDPFACNIFVYSTIKGFSEDSVHHIFGCMGNSAQIRYRQIAVQILRNVIQSDL